MNKKIIVGILLVFSLLLVVGCTKKQEGNDIKPDNKQEEKEQQEQEQEDYRINATKDNEKYVFTAEGYKEIYYYSGDKITRYISYTTYENEERAKEAYNQKDEFKDLIKDIKIEGKEITVEWTEAAYKNTTISLLEERMKLYEK